MDMPVLLSLSLFVVSILAIVVEAKQSGGYTVNVGTGCSGKTIHSLKVIDVFGSINIGSHNYTRCLGTPDGEAPERRDLDHSNVVRDLALSSRDSGQCDLPCGCGCINVGGDDCVPGNDKVALTKSVSVITPVFRDTCYNPDWSFGPYVPEATFPVQQDIARSHCPNALNFILGIFLAPGGIAKTVGSCLDYCGIDNSKYLGSMKYYDLYYWDTYSGNWGGLYTNVAYGTKNILASAIETIFDITNDAIAFPDDMFQAYLGATGAIIDQKTGFATVTKAQFLKMQPLHIEFGSDTYVVSPDAQLYPRSRNAEIGGTSTGYYLIVKNDPDDFYSEGIVLGTPFFQTAYVVIDAVRSSYTIDDVAGDYYATQRIGIAQTLYTGKTYNS